MAREHTLPLSLLGMAMRHGLYRYCFCEGRMSLREKSLVVKLPWTMYWLVHVVLQERERVLCLC